VAGVTSDNWTFDLVTDTGGAGQPIDSDNIGGTSRRGVWENDGTSMAGSDASLVDRNHYYVQLVKVGSPSDITDVNITLVWRSGY
jgi:hypothetical protein